MEAKKYTRKKNPQVRGFSTIRTGKGSQRIFYIRSPRIRNFLTTHKITNGLDYLDTDDGQIPHYEDSQEGLIRHLAHMDKRVRHRNFILGEYLREQYFNALLEVEDIAQMNSGIKQTIIEDFAGMVGDYGKHVGHDNTEQLKRVVESTAKF